jgi:hypothetical protein
MPTACLARLLDCIQAISTMVDQAGFAGLTRFESVVYVQHGQVVSLGMSELSLGHVRLLPGVVGSNKDIRYWTRKA